MLEATIIADGVEEDIDETLAEVRGTIDEDTDELADDVAAVVATVVAAIVVCKTLRVVHAEESQKLDVNARRWLLRLFENADVVTRAEVEGVGDVVTAVSRRRYSHQKVKECGSVVQMAVGRHGGCDRGWSANSRG